jgi:hypothetical protein
MSSGPVDILDKFRKIEYNFNKNYLLTLYQIKEIVQDAKTEKEADQLQKLDDSYKRWFDTLQRDPKCMDACQFFYEAVGDNNELLKSKNENIFEMQGDFFSLIFDQEGLSTTFLYGLLNDGSDPTCSEDAKCNLWDALNGLYGLAVLICIYLKMPLVKEIIDVILVSNPTLNQKNVFETIMKEFKGKRTLRKLIMKLLKSKDDNFSEIFKCLQKVMSTFSSGVNASYQINPNLQNQKPNSTSLEVISKLVGDMKIEDRDQLTTALEEKDDHTLESLVSRGCVTKEQMEQVKINFNLKNLATPEVVGDLGKTMEKVMSAFNTDSEVDIQKIFEESGMNFGGIDISKLQGELSGFENEIDEDESESEGGEDKQTDNGIKSSTLEEIVSTVNHGCCDGKTEGIKMNEGKQTGDGKPDGIELNENISGSDSKQTDNGIVSSTLEKMVTVNNGCCDGKTEGIKMNEGKQTGDGKPEGIDLNENISGSDSKQTDNGIVSSTLEKMVSTVNSDIYNDKTEGIKLNEDISRNDYKKNQWDGSGTGL